jgi:hypothetical protein
MLAQAADVCPLQRPGLGVQAVDRQRGFELIDPGRTRRDRLRSYHTGVRQCGQHCHRHHPKAHPPGPGNQSSNGTMLRQTHLYGNLDDFHRRLDHWRGDVQGMSMGTR